MKIDNIKKKSKLKCPTVLDPKGYVVALDHQGF